MKSSVAYTLANILYFQIGWFVCILFGDLWAFLFTLTVLSLHFYASKLKQSDAILVSLALVLGLIHDTILIHVDILQFPGGPSFPPFWMMCLWALLGITLNHSMNWIYERPRWAAVFGAVFAPLSYLAGAKLSGAQWLSSVTVAMFTIAIMWLFVLPLHRWVSLKVLSYAKVNSVSG
jgi:hypothetical protein